MDAEMIADLKESYGLTCHQITPVTGGFLNRKWKVSTDQGDVLVKQYSNERFRKDDIARIESRLKRQVAVAKIGVPCPFLRQHEGRIIRWMNDETAYIAMDFCPGRIEKPDTITASQMRSLGNACAAMHSAFSRLPLPSDRSLPTFGGYTIDLLWKNLRTRMAECAPDAPAEYRRALSALEPILKGLDAGFFDRFPKGFAHEDFHAGNLLFHEDRVSAILDFDRNCYSYPWHDVGRAILSLSLKDGAMDVALVRAFAEGYSAYTALTPADAADALRLTWCIETVWWVQPEFFGECGDTPRRFKDEILWLTKHWLDLDSLLHW